MSVRGMQTMLATAVTDRRHREALLCGTPESYTQFDLSADEVKALQTIQANSLEEFALAAHQIFYGEDLTSIRPLRTERRSWGRPFQPSMEDPAFIRPASAHALVQRGSA